MNVLNATSRYMKGERFTGPIPKPRPHIFDKIDAQHEAVRLERRVYAEVDARDGKQCRCCGRKGNPHALTAIGRIHRAHIKDASLQGTMKAGNLVSLCWICHALEHAKQLCMLGKDANRLLRFEIQEQAVVEVFGSRHLPPYVKIVTSSRRVREGT